MSSKVAQIRKAIKKRKSDLSRYKKKRMYCPVYDEQIWAYAIPPGEFDELTLNPGRVNDCPENNIAEIADHMEVKGQEEPILVQWDESTGQWLVVYGCNRFRAANKLISRSPDFEIPYSEGNCIWCNIFTGSDAELNDIKTKENFKAKKPGVRGTKEDLISQLDERIRMGWLKPEKEDVRTYLKGAAPGYAGRKFSGVWNGLQAKSSLLKKKFKTWGKDDIAKYFANNNEVDHILTPGEKTPESGHIIEFDNKKIAIYYVSSSTEPNGALPTNAAKKKFVNKACDEVWVVAAFNNGTNSANIAKTRDACVKALKEWNDNVKKTFDRLICVPQSESEHRNMVYSGDYALDKCL